LPSVRLKIRSLVFIQSTLGTLGSRLLELQIPLLHGDGPWRNRLDRFRETLRSRAEMLSTLKSMTAPEVEL
jgi:type I restriction enzyme M protein